MFHVLRASCVRSGSVWNKPSPVLRTHWRQVSRTQPGATTKWASKLTEDVGKLAVLAGAGTGIGAICLYGVLSPTHESAMDQQIAWPGYVRQRIRSTYSMYTIGLATTAATALALTRRPRAIGPVMKALNSQWGVMAAMAGCMATGVAVQMTPYTGTIGLKHLMWLGHSACVGVMISPMIAIFGPLAARAALYTGASLGGLSLIAVTAPSDKFLYMGGALGMGFMVLFATNIVSIFAGPALFPVVNNVCMYGGVLLFSGFSLYHTQSIIDRAIRTPVEPNTEVKPYFDPINNAIGLYAATINMFITILRIMAFNNRKK